MLLAILVRGLKGERGSVVCLWALMVIGDWCEGEAEVVHSRQNQQFQYSKNPKNPTQILFAQICTNNQTKSKIGNEGLCCIEA